MRRQHANLPNCLLRRQAWRRDPERPCVTRLFARVELREKVVCALVRRTDFERRMRDRTDDDTAYKPRFAPSF